MKQKGVKEKVMRAFCPCCCWMNEKFQKKRQGDSQRFCESSSDTGNMQLPYNSPGGYLVHVVFFQCIYFPINGPGRRSGKPWYQNQAFRKVPTLRNAKSSAISQLEIQQNKST